VARRTSLVLLPLIVLLATWELAASAPRIRFLFGTPTLIVKRLVGDTLNGFLPYHAMITGGEALAGFVLGVLSGTLLGFLLWYSPLVARIAKPYLFVLSIIPSFAFAPIIIIWFGIGMSMKVAVATFATFLVALGQSYEGCGTIDPKMFELMRVMGATRSQTLRTLVFPASLSWVFNSLKLNIGVALLGAFIGEFISADRGIGFYMIRAGSLYDMPGVWAGAVYLVLLAALLHVAVVKLELRKLSIARLFSVKRVPKLRYLSDGSKLG